MCNLYSNTTAAELMRQKLNVRLGLERLGNAPPRTGIRPNYSAPVVRLTEIGDLELTKMK